MKHANFFSTSARLLTIAAFAASALFITSCDNDPEPEPEATETIWEIVSGNTSLSQLTAVLDSAGMQAALSAEGEFTLFAPDNTAFTNLLATPGFPQDIYSINPAIIANVLAYHLVEGEYELSDLVNDLEMTSESAGNEKIRVIVTAGVVTLRTGSSNLNIEIKTSNIKATNGVIHIVESVMIPPTVGAQLTPILGTAAGTVLLGAPFSHLATLIQKADAGKPAAETIAGILANKTEGYKVTIFSPANAVFEGAAAAASLTVEAYLNAMSAATANAIVRNHIVVGTAHTSTTMTNGQSLTTVLPQTLTVSLGTVSATNPNGITIISQGFNPEAPTAGGAAPIFTKDITVTNGVVHAVGGILKPAL